MDKSKILTDAEYASIVITLLRKPYSVSSISKLMFIAFCVKHENNKLSYANRSKDFVDCFFKNISLKLSAHYTELNNILFILDMLKTTSLIHIDGDSIELTQDIEHETENSFLKFCESKIPNPIIEVNKLNAKALVEEVIRYV